MKKNFFKKLAATLAFAMVVTSVAPAATASAAAGITQKNGSTASTVYVTKSYGLKLGKGVNAKWTSSNKSVATVGLTGGVLKPVAPGKVTITAVSKNTGKSYKKTFTVKQRATSVELGDDLSLAVGDTAQLDAELTPSVSTDVIRYFSDNKEVATVGMTGGKVTAKANGEATITVYAKATTASSNASKMNKVDTIKVQVGTFIQSATQNSVTKLDVLFNTDMKDAKAADFKIVRDDTNQEFAIKEAKVDGKKVTLETYSEINDGATYTVTYGDSSYKFVATNGKVASLSVVPSTITYNKETEIKLQAKDANGVTVKEMKYGSLDTDYDFEIETENGYTTDSKLVLYKVGDTAKATATLHTYEYDSNGNEVGVIKTEATITAVEESAFTTGNYKYTISKDTPNWNDFEQNTKIAINDSDRQVFVQLKDKNDEEINYSGYYLASSNDDILVVNDNSSDSVLKASIYAVEKTGTAYVLVKNEDDKVVLSVPVTIVAERKDASFTLGASSVKLTNAVVDTAYVKVTLKDQFGEDKTVDLDKIQVETVDTPKNANGDPYVGKENGKLKFRSEISPALTTGTYKYKVTYDDGLTKTISVVVQAPSSTSLTNDTFKLFVSDQTADIVYKDSNTESIDIKLQVARVDNKGVVREYVTLDRSDYVLKVDGKVTTAGSIDGNALVLNALDTTNQTISKAKVGKYTIEASVAAGDTSLDKAAKLTGSFTLTDSQPGLRVERDTKIDVDSQSFGAIMDEAFKFYYRGNEVEPQDILEVEINGKVYDAGGTLVDVDNHVDTIALPGKNYNIKKVKVLIDVDGHYVPFTVTINKAVNIEK